MQPGMAYVVGIVLVVPGAYLLFALKGGRVARDAKNRPDVAKGLRIIEKDRNNATIRGEIWRLLRYTCHLWACASTPNNRVVLAQGSC